MNYTIVCVCGHAFNITDQQLTGHVTCPACGRALMPVVTPQESAPLRPAPMISGAAGTESGATGEPEAPRDPPVAVAAEATKRCPYCGEVILAIARKCKHCGEFLDRAEPGAGLAAVAPPPVANTAAPAAAQANGAAPAAQPGAFHDEAVFTLSVSQWDNFWKYLICATIAIAVPAALIKIPALQQYARMGVPAAVVLMGFIAWFFYLSTRNARCIIRPLRIETEVGILAKDVNSLEYFRIIDLELQQKIISRLLGIGTIRITSSDATTPELIIYQIPKARQVFKYLQTQVPLAARQRGAYYVEK